MFGSYNERMYLAEAGAPRDLHPGVVPGRGHPAPYRHALHGLRRRDLLVQEVCNALFDALFNILPLAADLDRVEPTPARLHEEMLWGDEAKALLDEVLEAQPVLVRISAAKRLRDAAESGARRAGDGRVTTALCRKRARGSDAWAARHENDRSDLVPVIPQFHAEHPNREENRCPTMPNRPSIEGPSRTEHRVAT